MNLGKILVAIDGSEYSDYALNVAIMIGEKYSSKIGLLHVQHHAASSSASHTAPVDTTIGGAPAAVLPTSAPSASEIAKEKAEDLLADRLKIVLERGLECSATTVQATDAGSEIIKFADSGDYDLIVVGSRGRGGLMSFLLGSVSSKVAKEAKRSVLVVKTRIEKVAPKIMVGYDGSDESKKALELTADLGKKLEARVDLVSVFNVPVTPEAYLGTEIDKWEKELRDQLDSAIAGLRAGGLTSEGKILDHVNVSAALAEAGEKGSYDLIAVGSKGHGRLTSLLLGSVASGVANSAKTNVLIVR